MQQRLQHRLYYKVARVRYGNLTSAFIHAGGEIIYRLGEIVRPLKGCGPLCVFGTLDAAIFFCEGEGSPERRLRIYACQIEPSRAHRIWASGEEAGLCWLPSGTVLARQVKLVRQVM